MKDRPVYRLTKHFFNSLFDLGFLSEAGSESFQRLIVGICALFLSFGLVLARVAVSGGSVPLGEDPERLRQAIIAHEAFLMVIPMWIVAFVTVLVSQSLYPDERDFRILMPLPITSRLVFGTKLLAVALFGGLFILAVHGALALLVIIRTLGFSAAESTWFPFRFAAFELVSMGASAFAVLLVVALNGLLVLWAPRARLVTATAVLRSAMLSILILTLPVVARLSAQVHWFKDGSLAQYLLPPAWFAGLLHIVLGDTRLPAVPLAQTAVVSFGFALGIAVLSYAVLYAHFDRVMLRPADGTRQRTRPSADRTRWTIQSGSRPAFGAIRMFTLLTLGRSVLHQGIVVCLSAVGLGFVVNSLISAGVDAWLGDGVVSSDLTAWAIWAPFVLIFAVSLAFRSALLVPIETRANWVFRMTEHDATRSEVLAAAVHTMNLVGVIAPIAVMFPLQWLILGPPALVTAAVTMVWGMLLVEILMRGWTRIPFTCSYIPGKEFVPKTLLRLFVSYVLFTALGIGLVRSSLAGRPSALIPVAIVGTVMLGLRRRRLRAWRETPLAFEDSLPTEVNPLRLSV